MISQDAIAAKGMVGTATAGAGLASFFEITQGVLSIATMILGLILSSWILYKEYRAEKERRASRKLKRRETDRVADNG